MIQDRWISIVAVTAWLVLSLSALRAHRIGARRGIVMVLAWFAIFMFVAVLFATARPANSSTI